MDTDNLDRVLASWQPAKPAANRLFTPPGVSRSCFALIPKAGGRISIDPERVAGILNKRKRRQRSGKAVLENLAGTVLPQLKMDFSAIWIST